MTDEDALNILIAWLRAPLPSQQYSSYGYGVYLPTVMRIVLERNEGLRHDDLDRRVREWSPYFYAAAWELCRRGILRPGIREMGLQATDDGGSGNGYSVTPFGARWIAESDRDDFVPTEPGRFAAMIEKFKDRYGPGFHERAQEAVKCYGAHAYLACCAMCGAAAESILLATATAKRSEPEILDMYRRAGGRAKVEALLIGQVADPLRRQFLGLTGLIGYWRDEAAHGQPSKLSDMHAYTAIAMLLRFAHLVADNWTELTA